MEHGDTFSRTGGIATIDTLDFRKTGSPLLSSLGGTGLTVDDLTVSAGTTIALSEDLVVDEFLTVNGSFDIAGDLSVANVTLGGAGSLNLQSGNHTVGTNLTNNGSGPIMISGNLTVGSSMYVYASSGAVIVNGMLVTDYLLNRTQMVVNSGAQVDINSQYVQNSTTMARLTVEDGRGFL